MILRSNPARHAAPQFTIRTAHQLAGSLQVSIRGASNAALGAANKAALDELPSELRLGTALLSSPSERRNSLPDPPGLDPKGSEPAFGCANTAARDDLSLEPQRFAGNLGPIASRTTTSAEVP
jgi:hypothetical protein